MLGMNVFTQNPFTTMEMSLGVRRLKTVPTLFEMMGLFTPKPIRTRDYVVEQIENQLKLVKSSEPGAPRTTRANDKRSVRPFRTRRWEEGFNITAEQLQGIREFDSETEMKQLQREIATGQMNIMNDLMTSIERCRLSVIDGVLRDSDDSVIYDYFADFNFTRPTEIAFDWANKTKVKKFVAGNVIRPIVRALGGMATPTTEIVALCGDDFFDDAQENSEYREVYKNNEKSMKLLENTTFSSFRAWGVNWINYRGTDNNSQVAIPTAKARFFPIGVRDLFQEVLSPAPTMPLVNTMGLPWYSRVITDKDREEWARIEMETHRLPMCTRPETLFSGRTGS